MSANPKLRNWSGKRVWILGASSGIGAALARALAAKGARVAISARRKEALDALAATDKNLWALPCDAAHPAQQAEALHQLDQHWGGLDVAIYAAGIWQAARAEAMDAHAIDATLDINLRGAMHFARQVLPRFVTQGHGDIGLISSVAGYRPLPEAVLYGTSKAALSYFAGVLHIDLARQGIGVRLINPGFVDTPMTEVNRFKMPAIISSAQAAEEIIAGYAAGDFEIHFPKRFTRSLKALKVVPDSLYYLAMRRGAKHG
jgi:NAD(P)-dependent dehydrogenase (short-subunit alcohol dehydrogenase family)